MEKKKADVTLPGVSVDGDGSFLEEATQIQIQKSKEKSARQKRVGTHDRRVEKGGMESYVFEDNVELVGSDGAHKPANGLRKTKSSRR